MKPIQLVFSHDVIARERQGAQFNIDLLLALIDMSGYLAKQVPKFADVARYRDHLCNVLTSFCACKVATHA